MLVFFIIVEHIRHINGVETLCPLNLCRLPTCTSAFCLYSNISSAPPITTMFKAAFNLMILGMGTVFLVLLALLVLVTLGGKIARRYTAVASPLPSPDNADDKNDVAVAVAAAWSNANTDKEKGDK